MRIILGDALNKAFQGSAGGGSLSDLMRMLGSVGNKAQVPQVDPQGAFAGGITGRPIGGFQPSMNFDMTKDAMRKAGGFPKANPYGGGMGDILDV